MGNPTFYERGKVLGDLLIRTQLSVNATIVEDAQENPIELGTPVVVEAGDNGGYTAIEAPANEANGILLETIGNTEKEVGVLIAGEIKESFYTDTPLSKELRTCLLKSGIILR